MIHRTHFIVIATAALLLLPLDSAGAQDRPSRASMMTGQSNPPPAADDNQAAAQEQAEAEKMAQEEAVAQPQPAENGGRDESSCEDAQGNPREC